jgi:hypothetical protein
MQGHHTGFIGSSVLTYFFFKNHKRERSKSNFCFAAVSFVQLLICGSKLKARKKLRRGKFSRHKLVV